MTEQSFRTFCAITIFAMFGLIAWVAISNSKSEKKEGIHIESPLFEYKGEKVDGNQDIEIDSPWFKYKGEKR